MESMAYISRDSAKPGSRYDVVGEMRARQKQPLRHKGVDDRFSVSQPYITFMNKFLRKRAHVLHCYADINV